MADSKKQSPELATASTLATGSGTPTGGAHDATLASGGVGPDVPVIVRTGLSHDLDFATIDPQRYGIGEEIARGGMGRIMAARDRRLGRPVAIKELLTATGDLRARFEREARITARLQHPAIVNLLEAGTWPGGEPFYVMKLVAGESLDKVIAGRPTLEARLGLLPNVIAAVDALAYAHGQRVIHRDLKPANVLVGEFGETVVIDWGLAKDLSDTSGAPELAVGPYRASSTTPGQTEAGAVMGTPAYMPREQAEGDPVDERADVYALGAMLYHVLAGEPPYVGKTTDAILVEVIAGPPRSLAARTPDIPPDLATIVTKAMAHVASDRYPTAKELADDLKKFQTGQLVGAHSYSAWQLLGRWIRRHRMAVTVAVVATVLLGAIGVVSVRRILREQARTEEQRRVAERSRGEAERNRGEAEDLAAFMLGDLHEQLAPIGRLDLLDAVAKKAAAYYDRMPTSASDVESSARLHVRRNLGQVLAAQGHADDAVREYRASQAISEALAAKDPSNAVWQRELAISHDRIGALLLAQGDPAGALAASRLSLGIRTKLAAQDPSNDDTQRDLAATHGALGNALIKQGDMAGAIAEYTALRAIAEALVAKEPTSTDRQRALSVALNKIGDLRVAQGQPAAALTEYRASLAITDTLARKDPTNADRQRDLSVSYNKVGSVLLTQGDVPGALTQQRASLAIAATLAKQDPTNADRQHDLWASHNLVGNVLLKQKEMVGALEEYRASVAIAETLAAKDPTNADRQRDLLAIQGNVGELLLSMGDTAGALAAYRATLTIAEALAAKDPTSADWQADLSYSHSSIGDALLAQRDLAGALAAYRASLTIIEALAAKDPTNADVHEQATKLADKVATCCGKKASKRRRTEPPGR